MNSYLDHGMGWLPDVPSILDYTPDHPAAAALFAGTPVAPQKVDLRQWFPAVVDQGQLGACSANAGVALIGYFERKAAGRSIDPSRLFLYKVTRNILGTTGDSGAYLRNTMGALTLFGVPPESYWPYDGSAAAGNTRFDQEPTPFCYAFGRNFSASKYVRLDPTTASPAQVLQNIRTYLAGGFPSIFGFPAHQEFMTPAADGTVAFPASGSTMYGGHAIAAAGYDDTMTIGQDKGALLIRNSWGTDWGLNGYAWMSYRYVTEGLANDWWTVLREDWVNSDQFK